MIDYDSPQAIKTYLEEHGLAMQKKFGQNFLINANARRRLIDALDISCNAPNNTVWEVGPGLGAMTSEILSRGAKLTAFEIDHGFANALKDFFGINKNFCLVEGNVLKTWEPHLQKNALPDRFFGNLPYNIAATLLADFITELVRFDKAVVTVQKEVALRMTAKPSSADYSSFSVLCSWAYDTAPLMDLAGGAFWPRPNVDSRAVIFTKKQNFPCCKEPKLFMSMQRALFATRRKTVKNNLSTFLKNTELACSSLEKTNIALNERAENLSVEELLALSDAIVALRG